MDIAIHRFFNFLGLAASLSMFVVMDEVETRRKVISQVFKNRYKKDKMPSEDAKSFDELAEKEADSVQTGKTGNCRICRNRFGKSRQSSAKPAYGYCYC